MKRKKEDLNTLAMVFGADSEDYKLVKSAMKLSSKLKDEELKAFLDQRINDIISMARYLEVMDYTNTQSELDYLSIRVSYLKFAIQNITNPPTEEPNFIYVSNGENTPRIVKTLESKDTYQIIEISKLLERIASGTIWEESLNGIVKVAYGESQYIIFAQKRAGKEGEADKIAIYDAGCTTPGLDYFQGRINIQKIKEDLASALTEPQNPVIQKTYDQMAYLTASMTVKEETNGYGALMKTK